MSCAEHVCISCGHFAGSITRPVICENPNCKNPTAGFVLEWDERADFERELLDVDREEEEFDGDESNHMEGEIDE